MCSYKKEVLANEATYNSVTVVMVNEHTDVSGGMRWISNYHDELVERFLATRSDMLNGRGFPSWGKEIDEQIVMYVDGVGKFSCDSHTTSAYMFMPV
jgi:hypothetical protein